MNSFFKKRNWFSIPAVAAAKHTTSRINRIFMFGFGRTKLSTKLMISCANSRLNSNVRTAAFIWLPSEIDKIYFTNYFSDEKFTKSNSIKQNYILCTTVIKYSVESKENNSSEIVFGRNHHAVFMNYIEFVRFLISAYVQFPSIL